MGSIKLVKCRKSHRCEKCKALINIGQQAYRANIRSTGPIYRCRNCGITNNDILDISEERYNERYEDLNKRIATEEF